MTQASFNLIDKKWIMCQRLTGECQEMGLRQLLHEAHLIERITEEYPTVTVGLYRILLAILHHEFGPSNREEWKELWEGGQWDAARINVYFDKKYPDSFDLFHSERPFLQVANMEKVENPVIRLFHHMNSPTLFDHSVETMTFTPAQVAKGLLAFQTYSLAHGPGSRPAFDGNASRDVSFFLQGKNLFETLLLNMPVYPANDPIPTSPKDAPCWAQRDPFKPKRDVPWGYLDYLTWQIRRVQLIPQQRNDSIVVQKMMAMPAPKIMGDVRDPFKLGMVDRENGTFLTARFDQNRMLWRDSIVLFSLHDVPKKHLHRDGRPPYTFEWLAKMKNIFNKNRTVFNYQALGMATKSGQNKVHFYRSESLPIPLDYFDHPELIEHLQKACEQAELMAVELRWATLKVIAMLYFPNDAEKLWKFLTEKMYIEKKRREFWKTAFGSNPKKSAKRFIEETYDQVWCVERSFWTHLMLPYKKLLLSLPASPEQALVQWVTDMQETIQTSYHITQQRAGTKIPALRITAMVEKELEMGMKFVLGKDLNKEVISK